MHINQRNKKYNFCTVLSEARFEDLREHLIETLQYIVTDIKKDFQAKMEIEEEI